MGSKSKIFIYGFIITLFMFVMYILIRPSMLEEEYAAELGVKSDGVGSLFSGFEKGKKIGDRDIERFKKTAEEKYGPIAFIAVGDANFNVLNKNKLDLSNEFIDSIIYGFEQKKLVPTADKKFFIRFFNQKKYYIFVRNITDGSLLLIFPHQLYQSSMTRLILELSLTLLFSIIITALLYIFMNKSGKVRDDSNVKVEQILDRKHERNAAKQNIKIEKRKPEKPASKKVPKKHTAGEMTGLANVSLDNYVSELFTFIKTQYNPDSLSLYVTDRNASRMTKKYEFKGHSLIRIESSNTEFIDIRNEMGDEMKNSSTIILDGSKKILVPIIYRASLLGAVCVIRQSGVRGAEILEVRSRFDEIARFLSEYIFINDVVVDPDTGFYSRSYFWLKYDEMKNLHKKAERDYSVMAISLTEELGLDDSMKKTLVRSAGDVISAILHEADIISYFDGMVNVLSPDMKPDEYLVKGEEMLEALKFINIAIGKDRNIELRPHIGIASTNSVSGDEDPLKNAQQNLGYAKTKNQPSINYGRIKTI
jgi:hypothetical protein